MEKNNTHIISNPKNMWEHSHIYVMCTNTSAAMHIRTFGRYSLET